MDVAMAYMVQMERLFAVDSLVAADNGNEGGQGQGVRPVPPAAMASPASMVRR